jgi:AcrR family transcriptional regulator
MAQVMERPDPALPRDLGHLCQRDRLLWSMVRTVAEKGYDGLTVAHVVSRAGIPHGAFYEEFTNKDECLFAAYDRVIDALVEYVTCAYARAENWPSKVRLGMGAFLEALAAEPDIARMATVEVPSAGPEAHQRYREALGRFVPFFQEGRQHALDGEALPPDAEMMAVGGAEAIIFDEVVAGRISRLPRMLPQILFVVLVPYLGPERAANEMRLTAETA